MKTKFCLSLICSPPSVSSSYGYNPTSPRITGQETAFSMWMGYLHLVHPPAICSAMATFGDGWILSPQLAALCWLSMSWLWLGSSICLRFGFPAASERMLLQGCPHLGDLPPCFAEPDGLCSSVYPLDSLTLTASSATAFLGAPWVPSSPWSCLGGSSPWLALVSSEPSLALLLQWFPPHFPLPCSFGHARGRCVSSPSDVRMKQR